MSGAARNANAVGAMYALTAFGIYSTHDVVVKFLGASYSPFQIVFFSTLFGFPIVTVMLMREREDGNLRPVHPWWTTLRTLASLVTTSSAFYAFSVLPLAQTYAIIFAAPLLITILAIPMLGETVGWRRSLAVTVGLIGVLVVLRPGSTALSAGHLAALAAAVFSAIAAVIVRKIGNDERSAVLLLYPMMANFVVMGFAMPFVYQPMSPTHLGGFALIAHSRLRRRAVPHRRLPHRQRRGGGPDAVFADPLGGGLRFRFLQRDAGLEHRHRRRDHHRQRRLRGVPRGEAERVQEPPGSGDDDALRRRDLSADLDAVSLHSQALNRGRNGGPAPGPISECMK